jgi:hypothetical protein
MPIWIFTPALSYCKVLSTPTLQYAYISLEPDDYVTFKKYRSAVPIQYTQLGGVVTNTTAYGPYHQIWTAAPNKFSENGYGLSISAAKEFGNRFKV